MNQNNREPTDPLYIFSKPSIRSNSDDVSFCEINRESPLDHYYLKEKLKAKNELHLLATGECQIQKDSPIFKKNKEIHFPDPIFLKDDIEELGLNKQSRRFDQEILNSLDFQNELSAFVQSKQINSLKQEKTQSKSRKKNPILDTPQLPSELYQSHYHYLPPEFLSPLVMSSPKYAFKAVLKNDKNFVDQLTDLISKEKRPKLLSKFLSNRAFGFMSINLYQMAIKDCNTAISLDKYNTFSYYLKGIILLFGQKELTAINVWRSSLQLDFYDHYSLIMKHLIQDHNMRHSLYKLQSNIRDLIYFNEKYYPSKVYYSDDIQVGYKKLLDELPQEAVDHFDNIIRIDPHDEKSIIGRSIALYQKGDYISSSKGFSDLNAVKPLPPEYSKFYGLVNASLHYDKNAVENLSRTIQSNPTDYDSILLRAEVQIERGHYKMALHDLLSLPDDLRTDKVFVLIGECYAWMGKLQKTLDALRFVSPNYEDSSLYLCHFIVARDHCDYEEAMNCIKKAVCLNPSFNLLTIAGDYFYSNACFVEAASFYQMALENHRNSPSVLRSLAFALIHSGEELEGSKILKNIRKLPSGGEANYSNNLCPSLTSSLNTAGGGWTTNMDVKYMDQWIYDFGSIEVTRQDRIDARMDPFSPILKNDTTDYRFILHLMNVIDLPFELAVRDKIVDCGKGRVPFMRSKIFTSPQNKDANPDSNANSNPSSNINSELTNEASNSELKTKNSTSTPTPDTPNPDSKPNEAENSKSTTLPETINFGSKVSDGVKIYAEFEYTSSSSSSNSSTEDLHSSSLRFSRKKKKPIIEDAERLGMKCIPITYEVTQNIRIVRALGLSVLYLAHFMRSEMEKMLEVEHVDTQNSNSNSNSNFKELERPHFVISHWTKPFDAVRSILQIADFKVDVKWISQLAEASQQQCSIVSAPPPNECFGFWSREDDYKKNEKLMKEKENKEKKKDEDEEKTKISIDMKKDIESENKSNTENGTKKKKRKKKTTPSNPTDSSFSDVDINSPNSQSLNSPQTSQIHHHNHPHKKTKTKRKITTTSAPFKRPTRPYTGSPFEDQQVDSQSAPMYFIQSGTRLPPRFQHVSNAVFVKLAIAATAMVSDQHRSFSNSELNDISKSAKRLYRIVQKDISSVRKYDNGRTRLQAPTITLRYLGTLGYEVYVAPPLAPKHRMRYYLCIEDCWTELIKGGAQAILFNTAVEKRSSKGKNSTTSTTTTASSTSIAASSSLSKSGQVEGNDDEVVASITIDDKKEGEDDDDENVDVEEGISKRNKKNDAEDDVAVAVGGDDEKAENLDLDAGSASVIKKEEEDSSGGESASAKRRSHYRNQGQLAMIVMLLWMLHPFSCYSPEIGHVILHAHLLACSNEEVDKIDSVDELFIEQMVDPDIQKMRNLLNQFLQKRTKSSIRPESISYWDTQRSVRDIINLIGS